MYCKVIFIHPVPTNKKKRKIKLDENENFKYFLFNKKKKQSIFQKNDVCVLFFSRAAGKKTFEERCTKDSNVFRFFVIRGL